MRPTRRSSSGTALVAALAGVLSLGTPALAASFPEEVPLPAGSRPEGIADGPGTTFFAGARLDGAIYKGDLRTGRGRVLVPGQPDRIAVGMQYDERSGLLWVAGGTTGFVTAYDGRTGREVYRQQPEAPTSGTRFLNDLVVTEEAVYVTDSRQPELVVVPLRDGRAVAAPEPFPLTGEFVQTGGPTANNANGIRTLPDGDLVVVQGNLGRLFRVDRVNGFASEILQVGRPLTGGDGLVRRGSTLYVVNGFADAVAVLTLRDDDTAVLRRTLTDDTLDRPTTGVLTAGRLWVVNGRFQSVPNPTATTPYTVSQLPLR